MDDLLKAIIKIEGGITPSEAESIIKEMAQEVIEGADPDEVLHDYGLEPDYVFDLLEYC